MNISKPSAHWLRRIELGERPAYLLIADLIAEDMRNGRLTARDRLPTLRDLSDHLRLNYTTVARAYAEARKRAPAWAAMCAAARRRCRCVAAAAPK